VIGTGKPIRTFKKGGESKVNEAGNYTKPGMRKALFNSIKNSVVQGTAAGRKKLFESIKASATQGTAAGQWSARKAQLLAKRYKEKGGGYRD
jgi:hypothetical protein